MPMSSCISSRELALSGVLGATALLLPVVFHLVRLGPIFMPMYLPLMTLAFLVRPLPAAVTAFGVPLLSSAVTGMPPLLPPVAPVMAVELAVMAAVSSVVMGRWPAANLRLLLAGALVLGRLLHLALMYAAFRLLDLPAAFLAGLSFLSGWPGIVLMLLVVPPLVHTVRFGSWNRGKAND